MFVLVNIIFFLYYYIHNYFFHCIIAKLREYLHFNSIKVKLLVKQDKNWQLQTHGNFWKKNIAYIAGKLKNWRCL